MTPQQIVQRMMEEDTYSQWLGIEIVHVEAGSCELKAVVREEMLNGHRIAHGGISYALSDSALAFASNSRGQKCVSIETSIAHIAPIQLHDELRVVCTELNCGKSIGRYESLVYNQNNKLIAKFAGTVFRKSENW
jgi:acyl-CoA thioesterase